MNDRLDLLDYYTLLDIPSDAAVTDVKKAFRKFARRYHPDRFAGGDADKLSRASQIYRRGSEAYQILTNPVSRRAYDRVLRMGKLRLSTEEKDKAEAEVKAADEPKKKEQPAPALVTRAELLPMRFEHMGLPALGLLTETYYTTTNHSTPGPPPLCARAYKPHTRLGEPRLRISFP